MITFAMHYIYKNKYMKIYAKRVEILFSVLFFLVSCQQGKDTGKTDLAPNAHRVKAEEVIQTDRYTYVRVTSDQSEYWIAINKMDVKEGKTYYWSDGMEMNEFTSKELKRTFRSIYLIQDFTDQPITSSRPVQPATSMAGKPQAPEHSDIHITKAEGGITIAELHSGRNSFSGKKVIIRGEVVKFSPDIMHKNWVHIQDGTRDGDYYDLTITTTDFVEVGEVATFEGVVALDKDFGAGYRYEVILENARLKK
jgi:hypothetical protein